MMGMIGAYSIKINTCNATVNISCLNISTVPAITTAQYAYMYLGSDGNIYLTNDTAYVYTNMSYFNVTYFNITYTNYTNITYVYNLTNGSTLQVVQNFTANDSAIEVWLTGTNFRATFYNKTQADNLFALKSDYATKAELNVVDAKYAAAVLTTTFITDNGTVINSTYIANHVYNEGDFSIIWKIMIIASLILIILLFFFIMRQSSP